MKPSLCITRVARGRWLLLLLVMVGLTACGPRKQGQETPAPPPKEAATSPAAVEPTTAPELLPPTSAAEPTRLPQVQQGKLQVMLRAIPLPGSPAGIAVKGTTIWVAEPDDGALAAVDVTTGVSRTLHIGGKPARLTVAKDGLWVVDASATKSWVRHIDPNSGEILAEVQPAPGVFPGPRRIAQGAGAIWSPVQGTGALVRIDPASGGTSDIITDRPKLGAGGDAPVLVAFGSVWVIDSNEGRLLRIAPATGEIAGKLEDLGYQEEKQGDSVSVLADGPVALAADDRSVWVLSTVVHTETAGGNLRGGVLFRIDPGTGQIAQHLDLKTAVADKSLDPALVVTDGVAWFVEDGSGYLVRVDLSTGKLVRLLPQHRNLIPTAIAASGNMIWVAAESFGGVPTEGLFGSDRQAIAAMTQAK